MVCAMISVSAAACHSPDEASEWATSWTRASLWPHWPGLMDCPIGASTAPRVDSAWYFAVCLCENDVGSCDPMLLAIHFALIFSDRQVDRSCRSGTHCCCSCHGCGVIPTVISDPRHVATHECLFCQNSRSTPAEKRAANCRVVYGTPAGHRKVCSDRNHIPWNLYECCGKQLTMLIL